MHQTIVLLGAFALFLATVQVRAQEEAVPKDKIPKAVMSVLLAKFPNSRINKCTKAKEGDDVVYDIEFTQESRKCEADITEKGVYINYEKAIETEHLPEAVCNAIEKRYPKAALKEIMEETEVTGRNGKLAGYEVVLLTADKKNVEVKVSPEGKILEDTGEVKPKEKK